MQRQQRGHHDDPILSCTKLQSRCFPAFVTCYLSFRVLFPPCFPPTTADRNELENTVELLAVRYFPQQVMETKHRAKGEGKELSDTDHKHTNPGNTQHRNCQRMGSHERRDVRGQGSPGSELQGCWFGHQLDLYVSMALASDLTQQRSGPPGQSGGRWTAN